SCEPDGSLTVELSDGAHVTTRYAFLTTGYTSNHGAADPYPLPDRVAAIGPGESVAIGGFGLSAMDLMSCLTVGRGGRFAPEAGQLRSPPSGQEPTLLFHSRSGLPCRARPRVVELGPPYQALVFTRARIDELRLGRGGPLDFDGDVLPLVLTEMRIAY